MHCFRSPNHIIALIAWTLVLTSCEKEIDLVPDSVDPKLVVEATIENDEAPVVVLTNTLGYFSELSPADLTNAFVHDADVLVGDGQRTVKLREFSVPIPGGFVYYYSVDPTNPAQVLIGKLNAAYSLAITVAGEQYNARTTIPGINRRIDSVWWEPAPANPDTNKAVIFSRVTDPPGFGNYIRYFTRVNNGPWLPGLNSVFDDKIVDGTTYDIQVFQGVDRNADIDDEEIGFFTKGDTADLKLSNIDKATFDFWRTWEQNQQNIGNPFGVPVKILSNISNGAVGYFGGYGSQVKRIVLK